MTTRDGGSKVIYLNKPENQKTKYRELLEVAGRLISDNTQDTEGIPSRGQYIVGDSNFQLSSSTVIVQVIEGNGNTQTSGNEPDIERRLVSLEALFKKPGRS